MEVPCICENKPTSSINYTVSLTIENIVINDLWEDNFILLTVLFVFDRMIKTLPDVLMRKLPPRELNPGQREMK